MAGRGAQKPRKYDLSNTNIGMLGTPLEKSIKAAAAQCEDQWRAAGKTEGIQVWRIEQFKVVPWPKDKYGKFYSGDSYIVLNTYRKGSGGLQWNAHFWIGDFSSQDEYGTAAYKTVELDDYLGGSAVHHREVQGSESRSFLKLFKQLIIMEGGADTGFNHVRPLDYRPRLLQVKGRMNVIVREVPLTAASLNTGDSFVFDGGLQVFVWHGKDSAPMEKTKAAAIAQAISDERGGKVNRVIFTEGERDDEFFKAIGGRGPVKSSAEGGADDTEVAAARPKVLLRVSDASGKLQMTEVARGMTIRRDQLSSGDVYILDDGAEVTVWAGKGASKEERRSSLSMAAKYLQVNNLPNTTPIASCLEGGDNEIFESSFEQGVLSQARPGTAGAKFTGNIDAIRGKQVTKQAAGSVSATYAGSGGPGVATDMDALYNQQGADPAAWKGRGKSDSHESSSRNVAVAGAAGAAAAGGAAAAAYSTSSGSAAGPSSGAASPTKAPGRAESVSKGGYAGPIVWNGSARATVEPQSPFDAKADATALRKAMKGMGTNEDTLINILCRRTLKQRMAIREAFKAHLLRDLEKDIASETSGNFCRVLKALVRSPADRDAKFLRNALKGAGTDDTLLIELLCSKDTAALKEIKSAYNRMFPGHDLEKDVAGDTSGDYKNLLMALLQCKRDDVYTPINNTLVEADAKALYRAGEARLGTDEVTFIEIFTLRSLPHLLAISDAYHKLSKHDLRESVARETSFNFRVGLQAIIDIARSPVHFFARRLLRAMEGLGTHDLGLIFIIIDRCEIDLGTIKDMFPGLYGKNLVDMIKADTSGDYRKALLALADH